MTKSQAEGIMYTAGGIDASPVSDIGMVYRFNFTTGRSFKHGMKMDIRRMLARSIHSRLKGVNRGLKITAHIKEMDVAVILPKFVMGVGFNSDVLSFLSSLIMEERDKGNNLISEKELYKHLLLHNQLEFYPLNKVEFKDLEVKMKFHKCVQKLRELDFDAGFSYYFGLSIEQIYYELTNEISYNFNGPDSPNPETLKGKVKKISNRLVGRYLNLSSVQDKSAFERLKEIIETNYNKQS